MPPGKARIDVTGRVINTHRTIIYNQRITSRPIGDALKNCETLHRDTQICHIVYRFPLGNIVAIGTRISTVYYRLAVVGGTGIYGNVGGQVQTITTDLHPLKVRLVLTLNAYDGG